MHASPVNLLSMFALILAGTGQSVPAAASAADKISEANELSSDGSDVESETVVDGDNEQAQRLPNYEPDLGGRLSRLRESTAEERSQRKLQLQEQLEAQKAAKAERQEQAEAQKAEGHPARSSSAATADDDATAAPADRTGAGGRGAGGRGAGSRGRGLGLPRGSGRAPPGARGSGRGPPSGTGRGGTIVSVQSSPDDAAATVAPSVRPASAPTKAEAGDEDSATQPPATQPKPKRAKKKPRGMFACCGAPR